MYVIDLLEGPMYKVVKAPKKKFAPIEPWVLRELQGLPQPITVNGGSYSYTADIRNHPLRWKTSDGGTLKVSSIREIGDWFDRWQAEEWDRYLNGEVDIDYLKDMNLISYPNGRMKPPRDQEEHELANQRGSVRRTKGLDFKKLTTKPDQLLKYKDDLDEVAMNPGAFTDSLAKGHEEGVKVGFEFEVCVPQKILKQAQASVTAQDVIDELATMKHWANEFGLEYGGDGFTDYFKLRDPVIYDGQTFIHLKKLITHYQIKKFSEIIKLLLNTEKPIVPKSTLDELQNIRTRNVLTKFQLIVEHFLWQDRFNRFPKAKKLVTNGKDLYVDSAKQFLIDVFGTDNADIVLPKFGFNVESVDDLLGLGLFNSTDDFEDEGYYTASRVLEKSIAKLFGKVAVFSEYHERRKSLDTWYIEPDGSLEPEGDDSSAEVVSPPLRVGDAVTALKEFYSLSKELGLYTNESTGLHINVSIPQKYDVLKLAVFLGDEYVLKLFNREYNDYAGSVIKALKSDLSDDAPYRTMQESPKEFIKYLEMLIRRISSDHQASVNNTGTYISFRHTGGDYLSNYQAVYNVMGRFVRALIIASNPDLYRREYLTKLAAHFAPITSEPKLATQLMDIAPYKTAPINVLLMAFCPTKQGVSSQKLFKRYNIPTHEQENGFNINNPGELKKLLIKAKNSNKLSEFSYAEIMKPNLFSKCSLVLFVNPTEVEMADYREVELDGIYGSGWNGSREGVVIKYAFKVMPGTPLHKLALEGMLIKVKQHYQELIASRTRNATRGRGRRR